jgi:orotate phosphoribosyltransferase-like protein
MEKNKIGRPTIYREEMCEKVVELLKEGASIEEIGLELNVGYSTIYKWMDMYPEFGEAIKNGREYSKGWWLQQGRIALREKEFNSTLWYMNMKNRHGWADKNENTHNVSVEETTRKVRDADSEYKA